MEIGPRCVNGGAEILTGDRDPIDTLGFALYAGNHLRVTVTHETACQDVSIGRFIVFNDLS